MLEDWTPLLLTFIIASAISILFLLLSTLFGPKKRGEEKILPYECGIDPIGTPRRRFPIRFFMVALIFLIFDIEAVFLFPWATVLRRFESGGDSLIIFIEMMVFLFFLTAGLVYVYIRKGLEWD